MFTRRRAMSGLSLDDRERAEHIYRLDDRLRSITVVGWIGGIGLLTCIAAAGALYIVGSWGPLQVFLAGIGSIVLLILWTCLILRNRDRTLEELFAMVSGSSTFWLLAEQDSGLRERVLRYMSADDEEEIVAEAQVLGIKRE